MMRKALLGFLERAYQSSKRGEGKLKSIVPKLDGAESTGESADEPISSSPDPLHEGH